MIKFLKKKQMFKMLLLLLSILTGGSLMAAENGLELLMEGNRRYINDMLEHPNRSAVRRQAVIVKQEPFAIIVSCSDSRVSPEILFDQGIGDLFVVRVAGNVIGPLELDSIEYSAIYLHSSIILVLGHENCGAVKAVIEGNTKDIESIAKLIEPTVKKEKKNSSSNLLERSIKANALNMKNYLQKTPVIQKLINDKKIEIYAGYYNLQTGLVELLNE